MQYQFIDVPVSHTAPSMKHWFCPFSPLHPAAPCKEKPTGQVQLSPSFTMPPGQPQPAPFSSITWFPGHCGARLELWGTAVVKGAANTKGKKGGNFRRIWRASQKRTQQQKPKKNSHVVGVWLGVASLRFPMAFSVTWF